MIKKSLLIPAAGVTAMALVGGVGIATAMQKNDVTLNVDGDITEISVREETVGDVLDLQGIDLTEHDVVLPSEETAVADDMEISVLIARPFEVTVDGETREVWTTAKTVDEALAHLKLDAADSLYSTSRSASIGRDGLSIDIITAKDVTLVAGGEETPMRIAGTVEDIFAEAGIRPDTDDVISHELDQLLEDGMKVEFVDVEVTSASVEKAIPHGEKTVESDEMPKGESEVTTEGADGLKRETYENVYHDGVLQSSKLQDEEVLEEAVDEVTTVGTYEEPEEAAPEPSPEPASESDEGGSSNRTGTKYDWMRAAGIPESQWQYVDYIVGRESGWNPRAVNSSSGACGLVQALPCSKLGANWADPVHALKWQYSYVQSRYGGYAGAYSFWLSNHWY